MKAIVRLVAALGLFALASVPAVAHAGSAGSVRIVNLSVAGSVARLVLSGAITSPDACTGGGSQFAFAFSAISNEGKAMLTMLSSALLARKTVTLIGSDGNLCTTFAPGGAPTSILETLFHVQVFETAAP